MAPAGNDTRIRLLLLDFDGTLAPGSWTLIIRADRTHRFASLTRGPEKEASVRGIQTLGHQLKAAVDRMDSHG